MKYLLKFEEPCAAKIERSGGKGANLALLTQGGFPVPTGFIVTAQAYRDFIGDSGNLIGCANQLPVHEPLPLTPSLSACGGEGGVSPNEGARAVQGPNAHSNLEAERLQTVDWLRMESERLRAALSRQPLPEALIDEVRSTFQSYPVEQTFSVRSSSTMEDLAGAAFAGQHETYLN